MKRRSHGLLVAFALAGAVTSCAVVLGVDDYKVSPTEGSSSIPFGSNTCRQCVSDECDAQRIACERRSECRNAAGCYLGCLGREDEIACVANCADPPVIATREMQDLMACTLDSCSRDCWTPGAWFARLGKACGECAQGDTDPEALVDLTRECWSDDQCRGYVTCLAANCKKLLLPDVECRYSCAANSPETALRYYLTVGARSGIKCGDECGIGRHWECLPVAWPPPVLGGRAMVTLRTVVDATGDGGQALPLHVRACLISDNACSDVQGEGDLDENGEITFDLAQAPYPIDSYYFELSNPNVRPDDMAATALFVPYMPITGDVTLFFPPPRYDAYDQLNRTAMDLTTTVDATKGEVFVMLADCVGSIADPEVTMSTNSGMTPVYGFPPDVSAPGGGFAFFINVEPRLTTIEARLPAQQIASVSVPVRANAWTFVNIYTLGGAGWAPADLQ